MPSSPLGSPRSPRIPTAAQAIVKKNGSSLLKKIARSSVSPDKSVNSTENKDKTNTTDDASGVGGETPAGEQVGTEETKTPKKVLGSKLLRSFGGDKKKDVKQEETETNKPAIAPIKQTQPGEEMVSAMLSAEVQNKVKGKSGMSPSPKRVAFGVGKEKTQQKVRTSAGSSSAASSSSTTATSIQRTSAPAQQASGRRSAFTKSPAKSDIINASPTKRESSSAFKGTSSSSTGTNATANTNAKETNNKPMIKLARNRSRSRPQQAPPSVDSSDANGQQTEKNQSSPTRSSGRQPRSVLSSTNSTSVFRPPARPESRSSVTASDVANHQDDVSLPDSRWGSIRGGAASVDLARARGPGSDAQSSDGAYPYSHSGQPDGESGRATYQNTINSTRSSGEEDEDRVQGVHIEVANLAALETINAVTRGRDFDRGSDSSDGVNGVFRCGSALSANSMLPGGDVSLGSSGSDQAAMGSSSSSSAGVRSRDGFSIPSGTPSDVPSDVGSNPAAPSSSSAISIKTPVNVKDDPYTNKAAMKFLTLYAEVDDGDSPTKFSFEEGEEEDVKKRSPVKVPGSSERAAASSNRSRSGRRIHAERGGARVASRGRGSGLGSGRQNRYRERSRSLSEEPGSSGLGRTVRPDHLSIGVDDDAASSCSGSSSGAASGASCGLSSGARSNYYSTPGRLTMRVQELRSNMHRMHRVNDVSEEADGVTGRNGKVEIPKLPPGLHFSSSSSSSASASGTQVERKSQGRRSQGPGEQNALTTIMKERGLLPSSPGESSRLSSPSSVAMRPQDQGDERVGGGESASSFPFVSGFSEAVSDALPSFDSVFPGMPNIAMPSSGIAPFARLLSSGSQTPEGVPVAKGRVVESFDIEEPGSPKADAGNCVTRSLDILTTTRDRVKTAWDRYMPTDNYHKAGVIFVFLVFWLWLFSGWPLWGNGIFIKGESA